MNYLSDYKKDLAERDKLADQTTGVLGYNAARNAGLENLKRLMSGRINEQIQPTQYGQTGIGNFYDAIASVNPALYDTYNQQNELNKAALESQNKKVGNDIELAKSEMSNDAQIKQGILGLGKDAAQIGFMAYGGNGGNGGTTMNVQQATTNQGSIPGRK